MEDINMEKPRMASARKVAAGAAGLGLVATGVLGTTAFASWSTTRSATQDFVGGELNLAKINGTELNDAFGVLTDNGGFAPGDTGTRYINLTNTGTLDYSSMRINLAIGTVADSLTADEDNVANDGFDGDGALDTNFGAHAVAADFNVVTVAFDYCEAANFDEETKECGTGNDDWEVAAPATGLNSITNIDISAAIPASPTVDSARSTDNILRLSYAVPAGNPEDNANIVLQGARFTGTWSITVVQRDALSNV
jgi:hypothetical protein